MLNLRKLRPHPLGILGSVDGLAFAFSGAAPTKSKPTQPRQSQKGRTHQDAGGSSGTGNINVRIRELRHYSRAEGQECSCRNRAGYAFNYETCHRVLSVDG